jgi:hypothetical protein
MERKPERLTDYPEVGARAQAHLRETEGQLDRISTCYRLGDPPSTIKDTTQSLRERLWPRPTRGGKAVITGGTRGHEIVLAYKPLNLLAIHQTCRRSVAMTR